MIPATMVREPLVTVTVLLALSWLAAPLAGPVVTGAAAGAALPWLAAAAAARRREGRLRAALVWPLGILGAGLGAALGALAAGSGGAGGILVVLAVAAAALVPVPLLYAATFPDGGRRPR